MPSPAATVGVPVSPLCEEHGCGYYRRRMAGRDSEDSAPKRISSAGVRSHRSAFDDARMLAMLLEHAPMGFAFVDAHEVRLLSGHGRELLGDASHSLGVLAMPAARALRGETIENEEWALRRPDGTERRLMTCAFPAYDEAGRVASALLTFYDVTEHRCAEDQALKAERLESIGLLARGIAHDFNNILTSIFGNIELAKLQADREEVTEALALAEKAFDQARDLANRLLAFAKSGGSSARTISLVGLLTDAVRFGLHGSNVLPEFFIDADLWPAKVDEARIGQAIQNVVDHAKNAMVEGGALRVEAKNAILAEDNAHGLPAGRYLRLVFEDEGVGIPEEEVAHLFEPYFKRMAGRAGLGLASAHSSVRNHGGEIVVDSRLAEGTMISIFLPASDEPQIESERRQLGPGAAKGCVLLMDDDEAVRRVGAALLARLGFEAKLARDGAEALALFREAHAVDRPFAAVILDLTVPGAMGGTECLRYLRAIDPNVRALVSSGYASELVMSAHEEYGFHGVVPKPYRLADLSNALAEVLSVS